MRSEYCEDPIDNNIHFNAELVDSIFSKMKRGKAAVLDGISTEQFNILSPVVTGSTGQTL